MTIQIPPPKIQTRTLDLSRERQAIADKIDPIIARILAARPIPETVSSKRFLKPRLSELDNPNTMADLPKAVKRIVQGIESNEIIGIETDHDCDGQTSHAILHTALVEYFGVPEAHIKSYIGHRLEEGYGLSDKVAQRILQDNPRPTLIITADNGSSDEPNIATLKQAGIDVIVTDHHELPKDGIPKSAYAVLNPTREDCEYPDRCIAGCMVAWLLMAGTNAALIKKGTLSPKVDSMAELLDFVAVGTIADCVSMAKSQNNRAVVKHGLRYISLQKRPCWEALNLGKSPKLCSEDLGFKIGPLLNSDGRLACAFGSVSFLLAKDLEDAQNWAQHLQAQNAERKSIQKEMTHVAMIGATEEVQKGKQSICLFLQNGHAGVHGISASRIKDAFGRPTIIFSPKHNEPELITGSGRSIDDLHLHQALQWIANQSPDLMIKFGGHQGAAGLTIQKDHFALFAEQFEQAIQEQIGSQQLHPIVLTDGALPPEYLNVEFVKLLQKHLEPFGREFEPPVFEAIAQVVNIQPVGKEGIHARACLCMENTHVNTIWFNARQSLDTPLPIAPKQFIHVAYIPKINHFQGNQTFNPQILAANPM